MPRDPAMHAFVNGDVLCGRAYFDDEWTEDMAEVNCLRCLERLQRSTNGNRI